jgi:hypothetical protein
MIGFIFELVEERSQVLFRRDLPSPPAPAARQSYLGSKNKPLPPIQQEPRHPGASLPPFSAESLLEHSLPFATLGLIEASAVELSLSIGDKVRENAHVP